MTTYATRKDHVFSAFASFLLVALLCWPALVNGSAIFYYDSLSYLGSAATAFREIFGLETTWAHASGQPAVHTDAKETGVLETAAGPADSAQTAVVQAGKSQTVEVKNDSHGTVIAGRSIYYGAFVFLADVVGSLWLGIGLQAFIVVLAVYMTFLVVLHKAFMETFLSLIVLGVFSSLPFYVSYLMPDFLTGIVILAVANLVAFGDRMRRWMFPVWGVLLLFGLVSHTSHILIAGAMIAGWGLLQVIMRRTLFTLQLSLLVATVGAAVVAEVVFFKAIESVYGTAPIRPPFLMARTISDGPGYAYLLDNCGRQNLRICDFIDVLPQSSDHILWSKDPQNGIYGISDGETRRELADQQTQFVLSVIRYDPFGQIRASFQGFMKQMFMIRLDEFSYNSGLKTHLDNNLPVEEKIDLEKTLFYRDSFPLAEAGFVTVVTVILSLLYIAYFCVNLLMTPKMLYPAIRKATGTMINRPVFAVLHHRKNDVLTFVAIVLTGLCLNAAVTGILSTPHDRYQARVIWLVPFLAMYLSCLRNSCSTRPVRSDPAG